MAQKYSKPHSYRNVTVQFCFVLAFLFQTAFLIPHVLADENTVIIIRSQQIAAYNEAIKGFEEGCKGKNISVRAIYDLNGNTEDGKRIIQNIKDSGLKPKGILAVGVLAATLIKDQFPNVPIIFCMVINHERFNLQGANITGISSEASLEDQFAVLKELLGTQKNVGVIYDQAKTGKIISEATIVAEKFKFNLIKREVLSEKEVASALNNIINKIDALWIIPDSTVITKTTLSVISKTTLEHRLPIFCTSDAIVKAGALLSVSPNYRSTGLQAAQLAQTLLNNPATTSLGIKQPNTLKLTLNTQTAKLIGINPSFIKFYPDIVLYPQ